MQGQVQLKPYINDQQFSVDELPLLTVRATLPFWEGKGGRRFNRYYRTYSSAFVQYCRAELFPQAQELYRQALQNASALPQWEAALDTQITCQTPTLISLYTTGTESSGARRCLLRRGDTWDLRSGFPTTLRDFFPRRSGVRRRLLEFAAGQIQQEEQQQISRYHPDWPTRLNRAFNPHSFYLTERGLCFFYQMYAIAPAAEGIPTFCLPYDMERGPFPPAHFSPPPPQEP
ncbi:MAG: DUF3298 domain-containing protein [Clostridiales bacterium]|nr:DUF3298 domain-containing protein [Candidatus Cacconaster stercorequi]